MKDFNEKHAALSTGLLELLHDAQVGKQIPATELAKLWTERNDARNYVVLGDPAVTLV
jgi:hypothetical protein